MKPQGLRMASACAIALTLTACGGGGSDSHVNSTPPPPPPSGSASVVIFPNPTPQTYTSVGASAAGAFFDTGSLGSVSSSDADQPHIRYTTAGYYEIQLPGKDWDGLIPHKGYLPPSENVFQPASSNNYFVIEQAKDKGYLYSELASWSDDAQRYGTVAFGSSTLPGQVPQTGSATYQGIVGGSSDVVNSNSFDGNYRVSVAGSVDLNFNFGQGTLAGAITLILDDYSPATIGTFAFKDTVFSVGSTSYSGKFDTSATGQNYFLGQFTGPNAEETIGAWALPFIFTTGSSTLTPDGKAHQAFGAWIAKKGP
jgi:hypothetical protein